MELILFFNLIGLLLFTFFSLPTLYQLQVKEYYMPRIRSSMKERDSFWIPLKMPAKSIRNFLITLFVAFVMFVYFILLSLYFGEVDWFYIVMWVLGTFVSKAAVIIGMYITQPLAERKRRGYIESAKQMVSSSNAVFVGVTGSYGKTSVKEFLISILSSEYEVAGTEKNYNSEVGVALSVIRNLKKDTDYYIAEMAAYERGTIKISSEIINPTVGFITGLGNQHLSLFGSKENLLIAKSELAEAIPKDGTLYINIDSEGYEVPIKKCKGKVVTYSLLDPTADIYANPENNGNFSFRYKEHEEIFEANLNAVHNTLNLLGVIGYALDIGIPMKSVKKSVKTLTPLDQKLTEHTLDTEALLLDDSYNSNYNGFISALEYLVKVGRENNMVLTKGLIELGEERDDAYRRIADFCENKKIQIYTTDKHLAKLSHSADQHIHVMSEKEMLRVISDSDKQSVILIEGNFSPSFRKSIKEYYIDE